VGTADLCGGRRDRWIHINDKGGAVDACHGRDVTDEIKIEFVIERRIDRAVGEGQQERITVRRRPYGRFGGDIAVGARPILNK
jgi:hypothetical protein